ncbi:NADH-quinone oxidoreductase subunit D [Rhodohalobacter barkolensis]|uniref:NADH-quinone oxidoreductase subunit D n=1 Tax=Rhodohalobacter barkolensis TaxID=2053187 RepID=A0A2N0VLE5_9BACT|nr:NADH-quinone oxidoreductase subunit D [Rhodohalobacter barkolensis]PKD44979.1 NADH-quinone oxidoreductase subunit NuoD [Rhodohalobacter barkolensis]
MIEEQILETGKDTREMTINMGPQHPSTHGVLRLELVLDGEMVKQCRPNIGYLHRCFEKYAESVEDYAKVIPYTDRMDYVSAMNQEHGYVIALERLLEVEVPERVEYMRVIVAELQRIASHLLGIGTFGLDLGAFTPFLYCFTEREKILSIFEKATGARLLYNYMAVGGLMRDIPKDFKSDTAEFVKTFRPKIKELNDLLSYNKIFIDRTAHIGILPKEVALNYAASGPVLRGSGVEWDLRKNDPYSIYDRFDFEIPVGKGEVGTLGDCWDRYIVRVREMEQSLRIIEQALDGMPEEGDVKEGIPKRIRPKEGEIYTRTETPRGELGYYIISDKGASPYRVKARAPSFVHLSMLPAISKGALIADMVAIVGSIDIVLGEVDR